MRNRGNMMADFEVRRRLRAGFHAVEKNSDMVRMASAYLSFDLNVFETFLFRLGNDFVTGVVYDERAFAADPLHAPRTAIDSEAGADFVFPQKREGREFIHRDL